MSAKDPREAWLRACDRYDRLAAANSFFIPMADCVRALAGDACAMAVVPSVDGVDLHLARASVPGAPSHAADSSSPVDVRVRALTDHAIEIRCTEQAPRARPRVRVVAAGQAVEAVEECLWELGWVSEAEWGEER